MQKTTYKLLRCISKQPIKYSDLKKKFCRIRSLETLISKFEYDYKYITRSRSSKFGMSIIDDDPLIKITDEGLDALDDYRSEQFIFILLNAVLIAGVSWFMEFLLDLLVKFLKSLL